MPHVLPLRHWSRPRKPKSLRTLRRAVKRRRPAENTAGHPGILFQGLDALEPRVLFSGTGFDFEPDITPIFEPPDAAIVVADETDSPTAAISVSEAFSLHSNPGAKHTIFLDFDGHVTQNTQWNSWKGISQINTPAYDTDGDLLSFSDEELTNIQYIFQRVAEDFSPFDVNVTTEAPPENDLIKSGSSDTRWGIRVAIGGSYSDWLGQTAGGIAYVGSFNWSDGSPVFVFEDNLGDGHEKRNAEAASHEAGHSLGLHHDGKGSTTYYSGHGSGDTGWTPIMGNSYSRSLSQWSRGEYTGASNSEDDLNIITTQNGFGYRADDHGGNRSSATSLTASGTSVSGSGIIERSTDFDMFSFSTDAGSLSFDIQPADRGANLDILAELLDSNGSVIASSNPLNQLSAGIDTTVSSGTYYLRITGTGKSGTDGYSDYASLGQYTISGQLVDPGPSLSVDDITVNEADGTAVFTVRLSQASSGVVTVDASTADDTATAGSDYLAVIGETLTFNPGEMIKTVSVTLLNDDAAELDETFSLSLSNVTGDATVSDGQAIATISDDDTPVSMWVTNVTVNEGGGTAVLKVRLSEASSGIVTVRATTANGTATAGSDYLPVDETVTFNPGETVKTVAVPIIDDTITEDEERVKLNLTNVTGNATITDSQGVARIADNDTAITVTVNDVSINEGNPGKGKNAGTKTTNFNFSINLSDPASETVTVQYETANGSALAGSDYTAKSGSVTFNPGETSKTVTVSVVGDDIIEADEDFFLNLLSATNASIDGSQGVGMIINDDSSGGGKGGRGGPKKGPLAASEDSSSVSVFSSFATTQQRGPSSFASFSFSLREIFDDSDDDT